MIRDGGCAWIRVQGTYAKVPEHCNLLVADGSKYCPKHKVMADAKADQDARRMEKARAGKAFKKEQAESLKDFPLKAYNPKFNERNSTYSR